MAPKLEGKGGGAPQGVACATGGSDLWKCGVKPVGQVKTGLSPVPGALIPTQMGMG